MSDIDLRAAMVAKLQPRLSPPTFFAHLVPLGAGLWLRRRLRGMGAGASRVSPFVSARVRPAQSVPASP